MLKVSDLCVTCVLISVTEMIEVMTVIILRKKRSRLKYTQRMKMLSVSKLVMECSAWIAVR